MSVPGTRWIAAVAAILACNNDSQPVVTGGPPDPLGTGVVRISELVAGPPSPGIEMRNPFEGDKNALADGRRYYNWFNCTGCHGGAGGGGIGPPLADHDWIYGGEPANVFLSIVQGRPYGMPSFAGQIPEVQVWKIVTYVSSLSGEAGAAGATADESGGEGSGEESSATENGGQRGSREAGEGGADR